MPSLLPILRGLLRYEIGASTPSRPQPSTIIEYAYDYDGPGNDTQYGNLRDEEGRFTTWRSANRRGAFRPYLQPDDITGDYGEFTPDPRGSGFLRNVQNQVQRAVTLRRKRLELDNSDSLGLPLDAVLSAHDLAWKAGLHTIAKNPLNVSDPKRYISHPSIDLVIMERDSRGRGSDAMAALLRSSDRQGLACRFVGYHAHGQNDEKWCRAVAENIKAQGYLNMGVTFSPDGEYTSAVDFVTPVY